MLVAVELALHYAAYDETEKKCASLLNTTDVAGYQAKIDIKVEGTVEWILKNPQYSEWNSKQNARLLWVTGYPGHGKTVLASFMTQHLNKQHS